jgi:16S rRNA (guanine(527)-N(7))-methyltransferase RsmG
MTPGRTSLEAIISGCGITLEPAQLDLLWAYHRMLRSANAELNLTRIHNFENMVLKHYVDSLLVLNFVDLPSPLIDMGSGPGLPGVPLKIARPGVAMILAEPRGARAEFLEEVCSRLKLADVEVFAGKVGSKFPKKVRGVITRAVASIPETLDRVAHCLEVGGRMIFMKGPDCEAEVVEARSTHAGTFQLVLDRSYQIPGTPHDRRIVVYERLEGPADEDGATSAYSGSVRELESESNPSYKLALDLLTGRGIRKHGRALIAGPRVVAEVLDRFPDRVEGWLTDTKGSPPPSTSARPTWFRLADPLFRNLDVSGTRSPLLLVRVPEIAEWSPEADWPEGCTLFVPFQDPENVGAVIRSAAAFGVPRVVLLEEAAHPFHPKAARAAGTALFQVKLERGPSLRVLEASGVPLLALSAEGDDIDSAPFPDRFGLVAGLEGPGLPEHLRAGPTRRIPMEPGVESLNAATATAVALYAWRRSRPKIRPESVRSTEDEAAQTGV